MKTVSINEIKKELIELEPKVLAELCLSLAKYKKDNKEFLSYLLFESHNKAGFIATIKAEIDTQFSEITHVNLYFAKKNLRKILRLTNKYIKYIGCKETEVELLIYFCKQVKQSGIDVARSTALINLYATQVKKINTAVSKLHEDIQYDFKNEIEMLSSF